MLSKLIKIAEEFNVAVFITNQVTADPGGGAVFIPDPKVWIYVLIYHFIEANRRPRPCSCFNYTPIFEVD